MAAYMTAMAYGLAYITAATTIIMLNKYMLSVAAFHYPIVLSSIRPWCGWTLSLIGVHVTRTVDISNHKDITLASWAKNVLPIGLFQGTTLMLSGNMAYFHLTLSFLQMAKALSPAVLFTVLYLTGLDKWHTKVALAVLVIILGTFVASMGEMNFTTIGFLLIFGAEVTEAFKNACMQFLLANKKFSMWEGMYFISPASLIFLGTAAALFEFKHMRENDAWGMMVDKPYLFVAARLFGICRQFLFSGRHQVHRVAHSQGISATSIDSHHHLRRHLLRRRGDTDANLRLRRRPRRFRRVQRRQAPGQGGGNLRGTARRGLQQASVTELEPSSLDIRVIVIIPAFPEHQSPAPRPRPRPRPRARFKVSSKVCEIPHSAPRRVASRESRARCRAERSVKKRSNSFARSRTANPGRFRRIIKI